MLKIEKVSFLSEQGKRANNEDSYGFIEDNVYVVCDGVGGNGKGEIASRIVTDTFLQFSKSQRDFPLSEALLFAEGNLSQYLEENPEAKGMATTLTVMQVLPKGIHIGWVGDSRIYQFRNGEILFQTEDHSWVNEALRAGIITHQESINHPKSNVITRAVQGHFKPTVIETDSLTDIKKGDIFLLCSDGILESWSNEDFRALFKGESDLDKISLALDNKCKEFSRDNYTAIVVKIGDTDIVPVPRTYHTTYVEPKRSVLRYVALGLFVCLTLISVYFIWKGNTNTQNEGTKTSSTENKNKPITSSVTIGRQVWQNRNLDVDRFRNGDSIPEVRTDAEWVAAGERGEPAWCYYNNSVKNGEIYGKLYNWYAVNDARGLAPKGWHIPTDKEWTTLTDYLGGDKVAAGKMILKGTAYWKSPNEGATNESGFSALPGGFRSPNNSFKSISEHALFWSTTESNKSYALGRDFYKDYIWGFNDDANYGDKSVGAYVRCLKD